MLAEQRSGDIVIHRAARPLSVAMARTGSDCVYSFYAAMGAYARRVSLMA